MVQEQRSQGEFNMGRDLSPKFKRSRREGIDLHPDLDKAGTAKSPLIRKGYAPGAHGAKGGFIKITNYGKQLREKQKAKRVYGVMEKQFRNYYKKAIKIEGDTGEQILALLESRLDNVVYRLGFAKTRPAARQMVSHGHILVNTKKNTIPSAFISIGDEIEVKASVADNDLYKAKIKEIDRDAPNWLTKENFKGKVVTDPDLDDTKQIIDVRQIIEFYSR
jgi:small subunit ribosomal protein S4